MDVASWTIKEIVNHASFIIEQNDKEAMMMKIREDQVKKQQNLNNRQQ